MIDRSGDAAQHVWRESAHPKHRQTPKFRSKIEMSTANKPWTLGGEHDAVPHRVRNPGLEMAADDQDQTPLAPARGAGPASRPRFLRGYATKGRRFKNILLAFSPALVPLPLPPHGSLAGGQARLGPRPASKIRFMIEMSTAITPWTLGGEYDAHPHRLQNPGREMAAEDQDQTPLNPARGAGPGERPRFLRE